ncbi:hypothetical protein JTB14_009031 [Gonioctena quinquepunctata]|nr:hypothetical protein JTB14_009031 [Gonioctena quinquepunctata]
MSKESSLGWNPNVDVVHQGHTSPMENNGALETSSGDVVNTVCFANLAIICGRNGAEKKQCMLSLLLSENGSRFQNINVYSSSLYHPKYQYFKKVLSSMRGVSYFLFDDFTAVIYLRKALPDSVSFPTICLMKDRRQFENISSSNGSRR